MEAYHNSRDLNFRNPFGAVREGQEISLNIDIWNGAPADAVLRIWTDGIGETRIPMKIGEREGGYFASAKYCPSDAALHWYRFELTDYENRTRYYGPSFGKKGGSGTLYEKEADCPSYQITVFKYERKVPDWYKNGIVYQIFPDRFAREEGVTDEELAAKLKGHKQGPARKIVSWDKDPSYERGEDGKILSWDFYGGSLKGITEKLPYLKDFGITVLYLNPIFEAASNHRYDTGDYNQIDPLLGDEKDFTELCRRAEEMGISVILDGVFNHTGCDSIYFNKYGNYPGTGAFQNEDSRYGKWFSFNPNTADGYDSWWGISDLPNIREDNKDYQTFIYGKKSSIVRKWMKLGAKGWRLDVADELPDEFIAGIKKAMLEQDQENALLLGEVWEDASNKEAYGVRRKYFQGDELDCVMNYPFRDAVCGFLTGDYKAGDVCETLYSLLEHYPKEAFYSNLNLIGSHDRMRIFSILGEAPKQDEITDNEKKAYHLSDAQKGLAKGRLWLASLWQMTMPGVPCVYYGDEAGMQGYTDPYNRGPYPWGKEDKDCRTIYDNAISIRRSHEIFVKGDFTPFASGDEVLGYTRRLGKEAVTVLINRSRTGEQKVKIPNLGEFAADIIGGKNYTTKDAEIEVTLYGLGSAIIYFSPEQRLGKKLESGTGVLCHVTSLPNDGKPGDIGKDAIRFLDLLKQHGEKYWQILPLNPTDHELSPYAGSSAFAGNPDLLPYTAEEIQEKYDIYKKKCTDKAILTAAQLKAEEEKDKAAGPVVKYKAFIIRNAFWIDAYAMYMAVKDKHKGTSWRTWKGKFKKYDPALWEEKELAESADFYRFRQFLFAQSWKEVRDYAEFLGIQIIGDMPIYVSADSADAWQNPEMFTIALSEKEGPELVAGVPPDYFAVEGQLWGNPLYRWDKLKADGYSWWIERFRRAFALYDIVRLDHFRGFEAYWAVPQGQKALAGNWKPGPGRDLFLKVFEAFGPLPVIAEDLGYITPGVRSLITTTGFPGMDVLQFYNTEPRDGYKPAKDRVAYTGTHDNETLLGWCINRYGDEVRNIVAQQGGAGNAEQAPVSEDAAAAEAINAEAAAEGSAAEGTAAADGTAKKAAKPAVKKIPDAEMAEYRKISEKILTDFYDCGAFIRIVPLQDLLSLDNSARMNAPGTVGTNWRWQAEEPLDWKTRRKEESGEK